MLRQDLMGNTFRPLLCLIYPSTFRFREFLGPLKRTGKHLRKYKDEWFNISR
jgi:hypothetical protein